MTSFCLIQANICSIAKFFCVSASCRISFVGAIGKDFAEEPHDLVFEERSVLDAFAFVFIVLVVAGGEHFAVIAVNAEKAH